MLGKKTAISARWKIHFPKILDWAPFKSALWDQILLSCEGYFWQKSFGELIQIRYQPSEIQHSLWQ